MPGLYNAGRRVRNNHLYLLGLIVVGSLLYVQITLTTCRKDTDTQIAAVERQKGVVLQVKETKTASRRFIDTDNATVLPDITTKYDDNDKNALADEASWIQGIRQNKDGFTKVNDLNVFLFSAVAWNSTEKSEWDTFVINAWEHKSHRNTSYTCCFLLGEFQVQSNRMSEKQYGFYIKSALNAKQFVCDRTNISNDRVLKIAVVKRNTSCPESVAEYIPVKHLYRSSRKTFGISGKVVHGDKDPRELVEWIEVQKWFGVDKILFYPLNNLNNMSINVLRHYERTGLVEIIPFHSVPMKGEHRRDFLPSSNAQKYNDLQVQVFDSEERLKEYTYASLMDTDEFLIPTDPRIKSYTQLMEHLLRSYLQYTAFVFLDQLYLKTWGKTDEKSELIFGQYLNRTKEIIDRPKMIFIPNRVEQGSMEIHGVLGKSGYKSTKYVPKSVAVLKHYRDCREDWAPGKCTNFTRITDTRMLSIGDAILPMVTDVRRKLGF